MTSDDKTKFLCPYCREFVDKKQFDAHRTSHWNDITNYPESLEKLKERFFHLGLYEEI
jgi:hypothetical protein